MAKGKHATALFEVISAGKKPVSLRKPGSTAASGGWFKAKTANAVKAVTVERARFDPIATARAEFAVVSEPREPSELPIERAAQADVEPRIIERIIEIEKPVYIDRPVAVPTRSLDDDIPLQLDPANREIKFRISYLGAIIAGFVLVIALAMAYLVGSRSSGGDDGSAVTGSTVGDASAGASAGKSMMAAATNAPANSASAGIGSQSTRADSPAATEAAPTLSGYAAASHPARVATTIPQHVHRVVGLHYVIAQSYPQISTAQRACLFLNGRGIACTVVPGPAGWASRGWYSVVGVQSFDHVQRNPALQAYEQAIEEVATQFAGHERFIRFRPAAYKWNVRSEADER